MIPHFFPEGSFIKFRDPHTIFISLNMLCLNIHSNFAQKQVRSDTGCRCDPGGLQDVPDHPHGKFVHCQFIKFQIAGRVDKHLVNGINVKVLWRDVFQINRINLRADLHIPSHSGNRNNIVEFQRRVRVELWAVVRLARIAPSWGLLAALSVYFLHVVPPQTSGLCRGSCAISAKEKQPLRQPPSNHRCNCWF